jgi:serine/threonine-protein kinase
MSEAKKIGRYEIHGLIGKGPGTAVYRGFDGENTLALKFIERAATNMTALARVRPTAAALAAYDIPGIAAPLDVVQTEKVTCVVSRLAPGQTIASRIKSDVSELKLAWDVARQLLDTIGLVHAAGITHGNLKPSNLFLDSEGKLWVTDFATAGLSTVTDAPLYMSPEQLTRGEITVRSDLYSVGAIIYHLVVGKPPFSGSVEEVEHLVQQDRPADPSTFHPKLAWQLDWVLQRALTKNPDDRFGGARELVEGLRLAMQDSIGMPLTLSAPSRLVTAKVQPVPPPEEPATAQPREPAQPARPAPPARPATTAAPEAPKPATSPAAARILDAAAAARAAQKPAAGPAAATNLMRVLFIDDEERILNALRALFRTTYDVYTAASGEEAFKLLEEHTFHIVVSDQRMPGVTGVELLREVKRMYPRTVRLLLTGYSDLTALVGSINDGEVFRYIKKPWDNDDIRMVMGEAAALVAKFMPTPVKPKAPRSGSLMVIDAGQGLATGIERLVGETAKVHRVSSPKDAAKILQTEDVAAVIADLRAGKDGLIALFRLLKAKRPETFSILVADEADAELVADLINHAQIFKFMSRPVNAREMRSHVSEALRRFAAYREAKAKEKASGAQGVAPGGLVPNAA